MITSFPEAKNFIPAIFLSLGVIDTSVSFIYVPTTLEIITSAAREINVYRHERGPLNPPIVMSWFFRGLHDVEKHCLSNSCKSDRCCFPGSVRSVTEPSSLDKQQLKQNRQQARRCYLPIKNCKITGFRLTKSLDVLLTLGRCLPSNSGYR